MTSGSHVASVSLDLDNEWTYLRTHGDKGWESYPSFLDAATPRILQFLRERSLNITFFIVGQDAALDRNRRSLADIAAAGHEIGNHSFSHQPWLHLLSAGELEKEVLGAQHVIEQATGKRPIGFRGPGYSVSRNTLELLAKNGFRYDASTIPTFIGPLARAYYFRVSSLDASGRQQRSQLFGTFSEGFRPLKPYRWGPPAGGLIEIPVTTMPLVRTPMHASYILYISRFSSSLAKTYFRMALSLCRLSGVAPSLLLHPLDFLDDSDASRLSFFPGIEIPVKRKLHLLDWMLSSLGRQRRLVTMEEHARTVGKGPLAEHPCLRPPAQ
jgi:hypothetical protein